MQSLVPRLQELAKFARDRQSSHPEGSEAWCYEHGVADAYSYAARALDLELSQGGTLAHSGKVVPNSSEGPDSVNQVQVFPSPQDGAQSLRTELAQAGTVAQPTEVVSIPSQRGSESQSQDESPLSPLQYIDNVLLAIAPEIVKATSTTPDAYFIGNLGNLMHSLLEMRFRHYERKEFSVSRPPEAVEVGPAPCPTSYPAPAPSAASSPPDSESGSTDTHNYSKSSSSSSSLSGVRPSAFDEEGNAPTPPGVAVSYSVGLISTVYVEADTKAEAEAILAAALSDMEEAAALRGVTFEFEPDGELVADDESEAQPCESI